MKHNSLKKNYPNLNKSGSFRLQLTIELDTYDDLNYLMHNINKHLEGIIKKNNKEFCKKNLELLPKEISINNINTIPLLLTTDNPMESDTSTTM